MLFVFYLRFYLLDGKFVFIVVNLIPCKVVSWVNSLKSTFHWEVSLISISSSLDTFWNRMYCRWTCSRLQFTFVLNHILTTVVLSVQNKTLKPSGLGSVATSCFWSCARIGTGDHCRQPSKSIGDKSILLFKSVGRVEVKKRSISGLPPRML